MNTQYTRKKSSAKEDKKQDECDEKVHSIGKPESRVKSIKRSDEFEPHRKSHKRHCEWIKSKSDMYCPNIKFLKDNGEHRKILRNYVKDKSSVFDFSRECVISPR